jgi:DNA-directed RNA polymerase subunit RPC12/RpoP
VNAARRLASFIGAAALVVAIVFLVVIAFIVISLVPMLAVLALARLGVIPARNLDQSIVLALGFGMCAAVCTPLILALLYPGSKAWECNQCGYDLRSLSTRRCPECGSRFTRKQRSRIKKANARPSN